MVETLIAARAFQAIKDKGRANVFMGSVIALAYFVAIIVCTSECDGPTTQLHGCAYEMAVAEEIALGRYVQKTIRQGVEKKKWKIENLRSLLWALGKSDLRLEKRAHKARPCYPIRAWVRGLP